MALFLLSGTLYAQQVTVQGKVTDAADGSPIPGANIAVKGKATGTISDPNGNYAASPGIDELELTVTERIPPGVYLLTVRSATTVRTKKIVFY